MEMVHQMIPIQAVIAQAVTAATILRVMMIMAVAAVAAAVLMIAGNGEKVIFAILHVSAMITIGNWKFSVFRK